MPGAYLVLFVADAADDDHAAALRGVARAVPGAGFFDDPGGGPQRTVGTYLMTDELADGLALIQAVATISRALTRVVSSSPSAPRSLSPESDPASSAGANTSPIVTSIPSTTTSPTRSSSKGW